ncbi:MULTISPECIES: CysB family HTH-type transcriptional regulator [unclassified Variovorax]|uniref:CysB family HTH-type transcriptional regulator n=1 Tax=Variovorax TaxID=34072 RepID=UPI001C559994|nr:MULTISPECIES: CysB family HTH-type transcriptional regulator [unclassified Variovorax]MDM0088354.1 CysB family HTH-type transcriptional regulator [Variovorax sp. J22G40]MDM0146427.1 CysB family HTH-type transcriptional regulator [Variovorax sp. J2P1-31]
MNFQQLRSVREAVRCGFNLTEAAHTLHTSQPGVSRQIRELEDELGIELFVRAGKRLTGLTEPGGHVLPIIERVLLESSNLRQAGQEFAARQDGMLSVAATHSQARYAMPVAVQEFRALFPQVKLHLHQGSPKQIAQMLLEGEADVGVATEALGDYPQLVALPCYRWTHSVVVPPGHPLLDEPLTLERLAQHPLITYDTGFTGRTRIDDAFTDSGVDPSIVLTAMDADVIKTYVQLGMGVGIVAGIAYEAERDTQLRAIDAGHLFGINLTKLAVRRGNYLRGYVYAFIEAFAPTLTREVVDAALGADAVAPAARRPAGFALSASAADPSVAQ